MADIEVVTDSGMPQWLKVLIWASFAVAAVTGIWKMLRIGLIVRAIPLILSELSPNGGESIKDKVNQAAKDSKDALILTETIKRRQASWIKQLDAAWQELRELKIEHQLITSKVEAISQSQAEFSLVQLKVAKSLDRIEKDSPN